MQDVNAILRQKRLKPFDFSEIEEKNSRAMMEEFFVKTKKLYHDFSQQVNGENKPVVQVCLTHPLFFDAFIANLSLENNFFVGLSYGVLANLFACFMGLLSHPEVLPQIGDSSNTQCGFTRVENGLIDFTYESEVVKSRTPIAEGFPLWHYPKDEERILYAILLADISYQFILYHEWGHLIGGHLGFLNKALGLDELSEMEVESQADANTLGTIQSEPIRKVMEFDADFTASVMVSSLAVHLPKLKRSFFQAYPEKLLSKVDIRDTIFFSIMSLFHLFQEVRAKRGVRDHKLYPSLYYRFCTLIYGIGLHVEDDSSSPWKNYSYQGVKDFARTSVLLDFDFQFDEVYNTDRIKKDLIAFDHMREELREQLKGFDIRNLPAT